MKLVQNSTFVDSNLGYGINSILPLTVSTLVYNTLSTFPFIAPTNPVPHAAGTGTTIQIAATVQVHTDNIRMWREYHSI